MKILCIIPARSGSKGIKNKNIKILKDKPLLAWSIYQAQQSKFKMKIIVSTDSQQYANIAKQYGAEVPFLRPKEISDDLSTDLECIKHCINWLKDNQKYIPNIIVQLRPTQPNRKVSDIDKAIKIFSDNIKNYDSLRSVIPIKKSCFKMYTIENNLLNPTFNVFKNIKEPYNQCRQILPQTYLHNGYIDIIKTSLLKNNTISGEKILPFIMEEVDNIDIDDLKDWEKSNSNFN